MRNLITTRPTSFPFEDGDQLREHAAERWALLERRGRRLSWSALRAASDYILIIASRIAA